MLNQNFIGECERPSSTENEWYDLVDPELEVSSGVDSVINRYTKIIFEKCQVLAIKFLSV